MLSLLDLFAVISLLLLLFKLVVTNVGIIIYSTDESLYSEVKKIRLFRATSNMDYNKKHRQK